MSGLLTWALATTVGTGLFLAILWYTESRRRRRYASMLCPACGKAFGEQPERFWCSRTDPTSGDALPRGITNTGYVLTCAQCGHDYQFVEDQIVDCDCRRTSR